MSTPYVLRLVSLCLASFFLVNAAVGACLWLVSPLVVSRAKILPPRIAERLLLGIRLSPFAAATLLVTSLCVPSYVVFEPRYAIERTGFSCLGAALLGVVLLGISLARGLLALVRTRRMAKDWILNPEEKRADRGSRRITIVESRVPILALHGLFRPRVMVSQGVVEALSPDQFRAALRHEIAHARSRDNWKRLFLLLAPDIFPFSRGFARLEDSWRQIDELAADEDATHGDAEAGVLLAEALVRVRRLGATPDALPLVAPFASASDNLAQRIDRLLDSDGKRSDPGGGLLKLSSIMIGSASFLALVALWPVALLWIHQILERLIE